MRNKRSIRAVSKLAVLIVLAIVGLAVYFFLLRDVSAPGDGDRQAIPAPERPESPDPDRSPEPGAPDEPGASGAVAPTGGPDLALPSLEEIRREVAADPHRTPPSVLEFSSRLAAEMEKGLASESYGVRLFESLSRCADDPRGALPISVRAICTVNAGRLASAHDPKLGGPFNDLLAKLPREQYELYASLSEGVPENTDGAPAPTGGR